MVSSFFAQFIKRNKANKESQKKPWVIFKYNMVGCHKKKGGLAELKEEDMPIV